MAATVRRRTHGHSCQQSRSPWQKCRCVCRGQQHGAAHSDGGLLRFIKKPGKKTTNPIKHKGRRHGHGE